MITDKHIIVDLNFDNYLKYKNISYKEFAELIDYNARYVAQVAQGHYIPSRKFAKAVERQTNGIIKMRYGRTKKESKKEGNPKEARSEVQLAVLSDV